MNISRSIISRRRPASGFAVLFLIALLAIMLMLVAANSSALLHLHRELKLLDQRQVERLTASQTNAATTVTSPAPPGTK